MSEPKWNSDDPRKWSTYYEAWYQIADAKPVCVDSYTSSEMNAKQAAESALREKLKQVVELDLRVEAKYWTVKRRTRSQTQTYPGANVTTYLTVPWPNTGSPRMVVNKSIYEAERERRTPAK